MNSQINVLHVYRTYFPDPPGGLPEAIRQICLATKKRGINNTVFTLSPKPTPNQLDRPEAMVIRARSWSAPASCDIGSFDSLRRFKKAAEQADVVHYLFPWPFADVLHLLSFHKTPAIMTYVSDIVRQRGLNILYSRLMWRMLSKMQVIVANSPAYARTSHVLSDRRVRDKVRVIPLGIDEHSYHKEQDKKVPLRFGLVPGEQYFLFIGVLRYYKGLHTLIEAAKHIQVKIVIAGSGPEGDLLQKIASQNGVDNVLFVGQVTDEDKVALIQQCLALILPSHLRSEAFGMVLVEAAMYGKPLVSCELGTGTSYVNSHNETGFVVPPNDPEALRNAMNVLLCDNKMAASMGQAARDRYTAFFSAPVFGKAYEELFREVKRE